MIFGAWEILGVFGLFQFLPSHDFNESMDHGIAQHARRLAGSATELFPDGHASQLDL